MRIRTVFDHSSLEWLPIPKRAITDHEVGVSIDPAFFPGSLVVPIRNSEEVIVGYTCHPPPTAAKGEWPPYHLVGSLDEVVFNHRSVFVSKSDRPVVLVTSPLDALMFMSRSESALSLLGDTVSPGQIRRLTYCFGGRRFIVITDETERGRTLRTSILAALAPYHFLKALTFKDEGRTVMSLSFDEIWEEVW